MLLCRGAQPSVVSPVATSCDGASLRRASAGARPEARHQALRELAIWPAAVGKLLPLVGCEEAELGGDVGRGASARPKRCASPPWSTD